MDHGKLAGKLKWAPPPTPAAGSKPGEPYEGSVSAGGGDYDLRTALHLAASEGKLEAWRERVSAEA